MLKYSKGDNQIVKIIDYYFIDLSKIKAKEEKAYYKKVRDLYKILTEK